MRGLGFVGSLLLLLVGHSSVAEEDALSSEGATNWLRRPSASFQATKDMAVKSVERYFRPSLDSMESADFLLMPALLMQPLASDRTNEKAIEGFRFDATVTEDLQPPGNDRRVTIYVRYWVTSASYQIQIIWVEPSGFDSGLPFYGTGFLIQSTPSNFTIRQEALGTAEQRFEKPIGARPVFRFMFGDYPPANLRFAEAELLNSTKNANFFLLSGNKGDQNLPSTSKSKTEGEMEVGFRGPGIKVWLNGVTNQFKKLVMAREKGGRITNVKYGELKLRDRTVVLPVSIEVRKANPNTFLRSASMTGFQAFPSNADQEMALSGGLTCFSSECQEYLQLIQKYGLKPSSSLLETEKETAARILHHFLQADNVQKSASPEQLQHLGIALDLARLSGDYILMEKIFLNYLDCLNTIRCTELLIPSGYSVIEKLVVSDQFHEAGDLLSLWLAAVQKTPDLESARRFIDKGCLSRHPWAAAQLTEHILSRNDLTPELRFEMATANYLAFVRAQALLYEGANQKSSRSKAEAKWVQYSTKINGLDDLTSTSRLRAKSQFEKLGSPTQAERLLARQLSLTTAKN